MRIWFVLGHDPWHLPPMIEMIEVLLSLGYDVANFYIGSASDEGEDYAFPAFQIPPHLSWLRLISPFELAQLLRRHAKASGEPDFIVACDPVAMQAVQSLRLSLSAKVGYWAFELFERDVKFKLSADYYRTRKLSKWISGSDFLLAPSPSRLEKIAGLSKREIPSVVIFNCLRRRVKLMALPESYKNHPAYHLPVRLIYTGRVSPTQYVHEIVSALRLLPEDVGLILAGITGPQYKQELLRLVEEHGLGERCLLLDRVNRVVAGSLVENCHIGLVLYDERSGPEAADPAPNKLGDYVAHGLAMVGTGQGYLRYWLEERGAGVCVNRADALEIADAISHLLGGERLKRAQASACSVFENELNMDEQAAKLISLLNGLQRQSSFS